MKDRKYLAVSIKHSAGTRFTLWGWERTKDEQERCFTGYLGTIDYDKCELYSLEDFQKHYGHGVIKCDKRNKAPHHSYLEPFLGSGAVLFNKPRSHIETVNDLDSNIVNLFEWMRKDPERLAREIYFTPYARKVYDDAFATVPADSFDRAVNFYIRLNMGHGFRTNGEKVGWKNDVQGRERSYASQDWCNLPKKIMQAAERLRGVQIENRPAVELIPRFNYPNVLIYADPPYVLGTRHGKQYRFEMDDKNQNDLLDTLLAHKGPVLLSGYDNKLYNDRLQGWYREETICYSQVCSKKREVLWMNFEPVKQLELFSKNF
ncbi:DNA adenine methylase [Enterocloster bolteae]|uniref:DNA adenine methylase n=1 Tax=Enterocloster bolteae TaxID=208479 RepID=UPI002915566F|nr:DNA adenine methylase [Enterocloster bolteae]MDU3289867.1 DNA adenine methylase [Enterocloster bolteae]